MLLASATVGFSFFLMELVWYRLLAPLLGGSVFTFGLVLGVALLGIGIGGLLYTLTADSRPATMAGFAASCVLEALAVAATFALGDRVALLTMVLLPLRASGFAATVAGWTLVTTLVVLPPAIVAGYQFPLLIALLGRGRERVGKQVGLTYAANTFGAIAGALAGGFGVLPWLSATGTWKLVALVLALLGLGAALLTTRAADVPAVSSKRTRRRLLWPVVAAAAVFALLATPGPTAVWRHSGIGAGRVPTDALAGYNQLTAWRQAARSWIIWEGDGVESSVALAYSPSGYAFLVNGKSDGSARADAGTQVMLGLLGALAHPQPQRALVIGLGTGATAGWLAGVPSIHQVDTIELEPLVLDVARACGPTNYDAMRNPKVRVAIGDARKTLLTGRDRYDVIASEPSNPFRAGIASLFTQEFYRAASDRLTEQGVFAQWVQGYEIDASTLRTIYATMASVFPQVDTWQTQRGDIVLLAFTKPHVYSARGLVARSSQEPFKTALAYAWRAIDVNATLAHFVATDVLTRSIAHAPAVELNTDDRNIVEFGLARSVGRSGPLISGEIRRLAVALQASRPQLSDEDGVSWPAVDTARVAYSAADAAIDDAPADGASGEVARRRALLRYYQANDIAGARAYWAQQSESPRDLIELPMLADIEAESGSDLALPHLERLRAYQPAEADTLLATLRFRQGRTAEAAAALEAALVRLHSDPWPLPPLMQKAVNLAIPIATRDPTVAPRLYAALRQRFVIGGVDRPRLTAAAELSRQSDFAAHCRDPLGELEPFVPWNANMLTLRQACYQQTNDPRLAIAARDLEDFYAHEGIPLGAGVRLR